MPKKKEPVFRFSGKPSFDCDALQDALRGATAVQLSRGGFLTFPVEDTADVLDDQTEKYVCVLRNGQGPRITDPRAVEELVTALEVSEVTDFACMCTGDLAAEFFDEHQNLLGVVRIDLPGHIEWPHWPGLSHLRDPARLERWLAVHWSDTAPSWSGA